MYGSVSEKNLIIENEYIKKTLILKRNRIAYSETENKICNKILTAGKCSQEFVISLKSGFSKKAVNSADLKIKDARIDIIDGVTKLYVDFEAFSFKGSSILVTAVYTLLHEEKYIRKHLKFSFEKTGNKPVILDYIDFERLVFDRELMHWSVPEQKSSHIPGFALALGQPVYVDSLYMGCEFPLCLNKVEKNITTVRYYSGKKLSSLLNDGVYKSYDAVIGVAEGSLFPQVQKAFFEYIRTISKPCYLRRQYNSWYDNMLNITTENVTSSFLEIEKGLTKYGEPAVDSYVADDGWNDYTKDFWCFNDKFPDGLTDFTNLSESFGSRFGLWLGPRGGYTNDTPKFAKQIEKAGNGYYNKWAKDICVASEKYADKTGKFLYDIMKEYKLNYFKLDGFAQHPCKNKNHDHMTGGYKQMYFYTDVWEKWLRIFEKLSDGAAEKFWINLTCYAPPSPWFLKWVNSLWMQISNDHGYIGNKKEASDKDRMLSYRDEMYFDFYETRQFQFPQRSLYNHDPIFGKETKPDFTDEDFRSYLYTMAARGTAFWELYYSHSLMNEAKWRINHGALRFIDKNMDVLSHSVIFGGRPSQKKCYGYACFTGEEGILCLRNSGGEKCTYKVKLDEKLGISKSFDKKAVCTVLPYTVGTLTEKYGYGDDFEVELGAFETRIYHFGKKSTPVSCEFISAIDKNTLEISFSDAVGIEKISCDNNRVVSAELLEDYMTVRLNFENDFSTENSYVLKGITDIAGNQNEINADFDYNENSLVKYRVRGNSGFSIKATLTEGNNQLLMSQEDEISLKIDENGFAVFTVGFESLVSRQTTEKVSQIVAVRERNGVMKLYFDGVLHCGRASCNAYLTGKSLTTTDVDRVKVYDRAFAFDEV